MQHIQSTTKCGVSTLLLNVQIHNFYYISLSTVLVTGPRGQAPYFQPGEIPRAQRFKCSAIQCPVEIICDVSGAYITTCQILFILSCQSYLVCYTEINYGLSSFYCLFVINIHEEITMSNHSACTIRMFVDTRSVKGCV